MGSGRQGLPGLGQDQQTGIASSGMSTVNEVQRR